MLVVTQHASECQVSILTDGKTAGACFLFQVMESSYFK